MKLEIIGMQRSWLKLSGETCSRRTWAFQEQGRRRGGSRTELSHAVLHCLARLLGQDGSWWCGEGGCAAMRAAPPPSVGLEVCPSQGRRNEGFPLPAWTAESGRISAFCLPGPWGPQTTLWIAVSSVCFLWASSYLLLAGKGALTFVILHRLILCQRTARRAFEVKALY